MPKNQKSQKRITTEGAEIRDEGLEIRDLKR